MLRGTGRGRWLTVVLLVAAVAAGVAGARPRVAVEGAWARPSRAMGEMGSTSAVYFVLRNTGFVADRLVGASTPVAGMVELHETVHEGDVARMEPQEAVMVPARGRVEFRPGGLHVMLMRLTRDLAPGDRFPVTLRFERSGAVEIEVEVREM